MSAANDYQFSAWVPWDTRGTLVDVDQPGVYLIARFPGCQPPAGAASPLDARIVYIGETCSQTLRTRMKQFDRSALQNAYGHSGGRTYYGEFTSKPDFADEPDCLHVAALAIARERAHAAAFIRYVERRLIWEWLVQNERRLICNRK